MSNEYDQIEVINWQNAGDEFKSENSMTQEEITEITVLSVRDYSVKFVVLLFYFSSNVVIVSS